MWRPPLRIRPFSKLVFLANESRQSGNIVRSRAHSRRKQCFPISIRAFVSDALHYCGFFIFPDIEGTGTDEGNVSAEAAMDSTASDADEDTEFG
jgi:hypothetical protein